MWAPQFGQKNARGVGVLKSDRQKLAGKDRLLFQRHQQMVMDDIKDLNLSRTGIYPEEDRSLPVGSHGKNPAEFRKYSMTHSRHIQLDSDLAWTDARKAAGVLIKKAPPLTADLNEKQRLGYEHLITDVLFHVPKLGHELLAGTDGQYGGLNLSD